MPRRMDPAIEMLHREMEDGRLYGEVVIKYEAGRVVLLKHTQTIKPAACRNNRDGEEE